MGLREWAMGGVLLSPFLIYAVLALLLTFAVRLLQRVARPCCQRLEPGGVVARLQLAAVPGLGVGVEFLV